MRNHDEFQDVDFDRLVDGEVAPAEYQQLLAALDDRPNGWRRLALAFLEAQAWGDELRAVPNETASQRVVELRTRSPARWLPLSLAAAASFLIVFCLSLLWRTTSSEPGPLQQLVRDTNPAADAPAELPNELDGPDRAPPPTGPWGRVTLVMDRDDGSSEEFDVPIFRWRDAPSGPTLAESVLPVELRQALERSGYRVRRDVRWTPLDADGGRRVFVPWGEVEITPVVNRAY